MKMHVMFSNFIPEMGIHVGIFKGILGNLNVHYGCFMVCMSYLVCKNFQSAPCI